MRRKAERSANRFSGRFKLGRRQRWRNLIEKAVYVMSKDKAFNGIFEEEMRAYCEFLEMGNSFSLLDNSAIHKMEDHTEITVKVIQDLFVNHPDDKLDTYKFHVANTYKKIVGDNPTASFLPTRASQTLGDYWPKTN